MLINPPSNFVEVEEWEVKPKKELVYVPAFGLTPYEDNRRVILFDNCPTWKCKCGLTMHGRVLKCVRANCDGIRPNEWKPYPWENSV